VFVAVGAWIKTRALRAFRAVTCFARRAETAAAPPTDEGPGRPPCSLIKCLHICALHTSIQQRGSVTSDVDVAPPAFYLGHTRFATSSGPSVRDTHPHRFSVKAPVTIWRCGVNGWYKSVENFELYVTHNGDLDFMEELDTKVLRTHKEVGIWLQVRHASIMVSNFRQNALMILSSLLSGYRWCSKRTTFQDAIRSRWRACSSCSGRKAFGSTRFAWLLSFPAPGAAAPANAQRE